MQSGKRRLAALTVVVACAAVPLAACSDDEAADDTSTTTTAATTDSSAQDVSDGSAACEPYVEVTLAFNGEPDPEALTASLDTLESEAPEEIADSIDVMVSAARSVLESDGEDFSAFDTPEFSEAQAEVDPYMFENCDFDTKVEVTGTEYAFDGMPDAVDAGRVAIMFTNEGDEAHEIGLARKADGVTEPWEELLALPEEQAMEKVVMIGGAFAPTKGSRSLAVADLEPGDYVAVCFIPTGTTMGGDQPTEGSGPPHFEHGMIQEFTVS